MAQFTQESFRFDLVWSRQGRLYADPRMVYDRSEALSEHIQAAKFTWVAPDMEGPHVTALKATWKDGTVQTIAPGVKFNPDASGVHQSDERRSGGSPHPAGGISQQTRF